MRYVTSVDTGKPMSVIGLGTWQFGSREWGYGSSYASVDADRIVARAAELGITLFDTAEVYGFGRSERILGEALRSRDLLEPSYIATKIFPVLPVRSVVRQRAAGSLARLGAQRLDLYQVHQPNPIVRDRTTMAGMRDLVEAGRVVDVGVSNYSLDRWVAAEGALGTRVISNQVHFSLAHAKPLSLLVPYAAAAGRLIIAWSPLGQGLLTAKYDVHHQPRGEIRRVNPLFLPENLRRAQPLLDALRDIATGHGATPAQVALAWLVSHPNVVAIPGASSIEQVESNAAAADIVLRDDELDGLTELARGFDPLPMRSAAPQLLAARLHP